MQDTAAESSAESEAVERGLDALDAQADIWADEVDLVMMIKNVAHVARLNKSAPRDIREKFIGRMEAQIDAIVRQAFLEGWLRGMEAQAIREARICNNPEPEIATTVAGVDGAGS